MEWGKHLREGVSMRKNAPSGGGTTDEVKVLVRMDPLTNFIFKRNKDLLEQEQRCQSLDASSV